MNERESKELVNNRIYRANAAIKRVEKNRLDTLNGRMVLREDGDYLLYSIANTLLAMLELTIRKMEERP